MRHRKTKFTLDRNSAQRQRLVRNLALSLVTHEQMVTTAARAKVARSFVERLVTIGKHNDLAHRRQLLRYLPNPKAVQKIMGELSPRYQARQGGYLRLTKLARRQGDGAEQVMVSFV